MSESTHKIYLFTLAAIVLAVFVYLSYTGYSYYRTPLEERFYHPDNQELKPSGVMGHGLGIVGSMCLIVGVFGYMARKRYLSLARYGKLKHWLEFHIFLATLGPVMILFHTAFKFGGIVSISFWSMVAVFLSGVAGRFIYLQIPRTIEGRELSLNEIRDMKKDINDVLRKNYQLDDESMIYIIDSTSPDRATKATNPLLKFVRKYVYDRKVIRKVRSVLKKRNLSKDEYKNIIGMVKNEISLNRKIEGLNTMQNLFKYWHVIHLPFALVMLVIMIIHVIVTITFGYKWIF